MHRPIFVVYAVLWLAIGFSTADGQEAGTNFSVKPRDSTTQKYSNWMSRSPEDVLLSQLSMPGTHNSCALHNGFSFGFAKCQSWPLADQLKAGIRFIDIRCRHIGDKFLIHHGVINQKTTFGAVRDVCREFLAAHPSECIVMSVKEESTPQVNSRSFVDTFVDLTQGDGKLWHLSHKVPKLNSVRGRIVLVDRVGNLGGLKWGEMQLQDNYQAAIDLKKQLVRSHLQRASKAGDSQWFINFCSGTLPGQLITPRNYALQSNQTAIEFLRQPSLSHPVRLGTIVMDFPGEVLIEKIVETNFSQD